MLEQPYPMVKVIRLMESRQQSQDFCLVLRTSGDGDEVLSDTITHIGAVAAKRRACCFFATYSLVAK